jgi:L-tartrate/succinate antiporter
MGKTTLGLGYAVMLADLLIAPFTPSNTGRSAGVVFPIIRGIPALYGSAPGPTARRIGAYLMWTAFASTAVTSSMFLTALGPNLLAVRLVRNATDLDLTWSRWSIGFLPVGLLLIVPLPLVVYWFTRSVSWASSPPTPRGPPLSTSAAASSPAEIFGFLDLFSD